MVEFALASVILFTLVFGVMAMCLALYTYNIVAEAAREASRYAIVRGSACSSSTFSDCKVTRGQLEAYVQSIPWPGINSSSLTIPKTNGLSWPNGNNNPGSPVKVTVTYTYPLNIPFVSSQTLQMSSTSQMLISQ